MRARPSRAGPGVLPEVVVSTDPEEAVRRCTQQLNAILQHAPVGILVVDADFKITQANPIFKKVFGETANFVGRDFGYLAHSAWTKEHAEELVLHFRHTLKTGVPFQTSECVQHRRDRNVTEAYEWSIEGIPMPDGRPGVVCYFRDITDRRQTRHDLSATAELLEQQVRLFDGVASTTPDFVYVFDRQGRFLYANRRLLEVWGMELSDVVGKTCRQLGYEQWHHDMHMREIAQVIQTKRPIKGEVPFKAPLTGIFGVYEYIFTPVFDPHGEVEFIAGTTRDVTERKAAEEALRRSEERLAQAVRVAKVGTFEHDLLSGRLELLPSLRELLGLKPGVTTTVGDILARVAAEDRERVATAITAAHDPIGDGTLQLEHRLLLGGATRWVSVRAQTFFQGTGKKRHAVRTIGAVLDITEQKELERSLERLVAERTARLQETVAELEHFSYTITHDMRAPLRAMQGFAGVLLHEAQNLPPQQQDFIRRIADSAARMDLLIIDALNYSKVVREVMDLEPVDPGALLRSICGSYPQFQPPTAVVQLEGDFPLVLGNKAGLTQCFSNLLGNAVKFVAPGTVPEVRVRAERRQLQEPPDSAVVRIWFEDNGIGIARQYHQLIFEMFQRLSKEYEGTGIGLALVQKVVERMRGRVGVESEEGRGSHFWLELPEYKGINPHVQTSHSAVRGG